MIFYFTGTGNSLSAATTLKEELQDRLVDIGKTVRSRQFTYELDTNESLGFVFPCYFAGIPNIVSWFIKKLELTGIQPDYVYAVITYGGTPGGAGRMLEKQLEKRDIWLDAVYPLKMPGNYIPAYDVDDEETQQNKLNAAAEELKVITEKIRNHTLEGTDFPVKDRLLTAVGYPFYRYGRKTASFWVDDQCVGCGACAKRCACNAIVMKDGRPTWVKDRCIHCMGCTNRCGAIQYGQKTVGRSRYVNPVLRKKKQHSHH